MTSAFAIVADYPDGGPNVLTPAVPGVLTPAVPGVLTPAVPGVIVGTLLLLYPQQVGNDEVGARRRPTVWRGREPISAEPACPLHDRTIVR